MIDLRDVRYFKHVAEVCNITVAADNLHIERSALTKRLQRIEKDAGVQLLRRLPRGVRLTHAGRIFLNHCNRILREVELAEAAVGERRDESKGEVVLGIRPSTARVLVPGIVEKIREQFPSIDLTIIEACSATLYGHLLSGQVDVAFLNMGVVKAFRKQAVRTLPLVTESLFLLSAPQPHRSRRFYTMSEVADLEMLMNIDTYDLLYPQFRHHGKSPKVALEMDSFEGLRDLMMRGRGVMLIPVSAFRKDIELNRVAAFPISDATLRFTAGLAFLSEGLSPAARAVSQMIKSEVDKLVADGVFSDNLRTA